MSNIAVGWESRGRYRLGQTPTDKAYKTVTLNPVRVFHNSWS
jgi:hypothetical protein